MADTMVSDFDVAELLGRLARHCTALLDASAAGLLLADQRGSLRVVAASAERAWLLELIQLQNDEGPCLDCYRNGRAVSVDNLATAHDRWPVFAREAVLPATRTSGSPTSPSIWSRAGFPPDRF